MANLFQALQYTLDFEGGFSNDPNDRGGKTKFGITQDALIRFIKDFPSVPIPDDVINLTVTDAVKIYQAKYWKYNGIESQPIATKLFDMGVNMGAKTAVKMIQHLVGVVEDGLYGPNTEKAINGSNPEELMSGLIQASIDHYQHIVDRDPSQMKFYRGWMRRARSIPK